MFCQLLARLVVSFVAVTALALLLAVDLGSRWYTGLVTSACLLTFLLFGGPHIVYLAYNTLPRDLRGLYRYIRLTLHNWYLKRNNVTVPRSFRRTVKKFGDRKAAVIFEDTQWSFLDLERYSNRVANYFLREGYKPGDCVALFMENRLVSTKKLFSLTPSVCLVPTGICRSLGGLCKSWHSPALINSNLRERPLIHSLEAASAVACIYGTEHRNAVEVIAKQFPQVKLYSSGKTKDGLAQIPKSVNLDIEIINSSEEDVPESVERCTNFTDKLLYIYTSGTTGLPKAAVIKHSRFHFYCAGMYYMNNMSNIKNPVFYNPLPLYHSAGGIVGIGLMMTFGFTIVLRRKFSVRNFWKDCCKYNCNGAQYIGEICRYLLSEAETPEEKEHNVELMFGNGLRPHIWDQFSRRFGISRIGEFYGSTEGNSNVVNIDSKPGAVGFASVLFPSVYPVRLIRVNDAGDVLRDPSTGLCILCQPGEPGEFLGKIEKDHPSRNFDGYVDEKATEKKKVHNVLKNGDMWFRSGDLLVMDEFGWMYFVDRLGDTFRWRGENVSTIEVEAVLSGVLQQQDAIVYGVEVPGVEGRAGMAAVVKPSEGLDLLHFGQTVSRQLPSYAKPIFLRLVEELDITGTFKIKKMALQREGYNPNVISDPLFFYDQAKGAYRALDSCVYNDIMEMRLRI